MLDMTARRPVEVTLRHPNELAILRHLHEEILPYHYQDKEILKGRVEGLLDFHAQHGRVDVLRKEHGDLCHWISVARNELMRGNASMKFVWLMQLFGCKGLTIQAVLEKRKVIPARPCRIDKNIYRRSWVVDEFRLLLRPAEMVPVPGEWDVDTIWWHWLFVWRSHVSSREPFDRKLQRFVALQDELIWRELLSPEQLELVEHLRMAQA